MAIQCKVNNITVDNEQGTVSFEIGPNTFTRDISWFFDRSSFNEQHMIKNLRLSHKIGTKADIASREFLNSINGGINNGMDLGDKTWFVRSIKLVPGSNEDYEVSFSETRTGPVANTLTVSRQMIERETDENPEDILDNIKSFLRIAGHKSFTPFAIGQIKSQLFWA